MSWDVFFMKVPDEVKSISEIPDDYNPPPLGRFNEIIKVFMESLPAADFSDPNWGVMDSDEYSIEINIDNKDPVESIMLHIRGEKAPIDVIKEICHKTSWRAIDTSSGDFMRFDNNFEDAFNEWKEYRDKVINEEE